MGVDREPGNNAKRLRTLAAADRRPTGFSPKPKPAIRFPKKFEQDPKAKTALVATKGMLAEASPFDVIWGIGWKAEDPQAQDPALWRGSNWLGQVLMHVRKDLGIVKRTAEKREAIFASLRSGKADAELFAK